MKRSSFILTPVICLLTSGFSLAILDTNNNGVSDFWEREYNAGELFPANFDPQVDDDQDGWNNEQEAAAGTDPHRANPPDGMIRPVTAHVPAVWSEPNEFEESYLISQEAVTVTWPTLAGKQYTLLFSPDLTQGSWIPVGSSFIANGGVSQYGFYEVSVADKRFWRAAVTDVDTDSDGLNNHEEHLAGSDPTLTDSDGDTLSDLAELIAGTNPTNADADGDGWTDPLEIAAGTVSNNQDTDGDGIPDSIDSEPLASFFLFPDADGDGIPDANDAEPDNPRGPVPSLSSQNASGNPVINLIKDEIVKFVLTVINPAGPAPTTSNLAFFLNGAEETANITAIGDPVASSQRFLLTWTAKTTDVYPARTLQNLTLRFRDSEQATSWFNLARIDVAEWEGMVAGSQAGQTSEAWSARIRSHSQGVYATPSYLAETNAGSARWYRGPKIVPIHRHGSSIADTTFEIATGMRYPLVFISRNGSGPLAIHSVTDIADPAVYPHYGTWYHNRHGEAIKVSRQPSIMTIASQATMYHAMPEGTTNQTGSTPVEITRLDESDGWVVIRSTTWPVYPAQDSARRMASVNFQTKADGGAEMKASDGYLRIGASITPHGDGSLEYPGLPLPSGFHTGSTVPALLPLGQDVCHKIILKVGPDAAAVSNGIGLWLRKGADGDANPEAGFTLTVRNTDGSHSNMAVPTDGKITLSADMPKWQQITSSQGLTVFMTRDETVTEAHDLSIQLLKKREWHLKESVNIASIDVLPVETIIGEPYHIEDAPEGFVTAEAVPTPSVDITVTSSTLHDGNLEVRLQGMVKDSVSRFAQSAAERPQTLNFYHQDELIHFITLDDTVGDGFAFDETVEIPNALPETYVIRAETTENIAGNKGYDESSVSLVWEEDPSSFPALSAPLSIAFAAAPSNGTVDQATLFSGNGTPQAGDSASVETAADSLIFTDNLLIPDGSTGLTAACQLKLQYLPAFSSTEADSIVVNIEFTAPGFPKNHFCGRWTETGPNSLIFRPGNWTFGNLVLKTSQTANQDLSGTPLSDIEAGTVRFPDLPPSLVQNGLQVVVGDVAYDLVEINGAWYPEDPDAPGEIKRFTPSAHPVPDRLKVHGYDQKQGALKFQLHYPGMADIEATAILVVPGEESDITATPPPAAARIYSLQNASGPTPEPWQPGQAVIPEHVIWAYRFLNAENEFAIELLDGYLRGDHQIKTGDVSGDDIDDLDLDVTLNDLNTDVDNIWTIQIEEDINPVHAARLLFEGLKQASVHREVNINYVFAYENGEWNGWMETEAFKTALAEAVTQTKVTAIAAIELYLSGLGIVNEGLDWIIVFNDVSEGHYESLAAALPFVPATLVKTGGHLKLRKLSGTITDSLDPAGVAALKDVAATRKLATVGTVFDDEGYSIFLRKVLSSDSGPIAIPTRRATLKDRMAAISPRPGGLFGWMKYEAHHDFPWQQRKWFADHGIDVNDAAYGRWANKADHKVWHQGANGGAFNAWWLEVEAAEKAVIDEGGVPLTKLQIIEKLEECRSIFTQSE